MESAKWKVESGLRYDPDYGRDHSATYILLHRSLSDFVRHEQNSIEVTGALIQNVIPSERSDEESLS